MSLNSTAHVSVSRPILFVSNQVGVLSMLHALIEGCLNEEHTALNCVYCCNMSSHRQGCHYALFSGLMISLRAGTAADCCARTFAWLPTILVPRPDDRTSMGTIRS